MDYLETFSPTANAASIRLIVALAFRFDWELLHLDIEQAFVQKSLYGRRQASRTFNKRLVVDLKGIGFEQCLSHVSCVS